MTGLSVRLVDRTRSKVANWVSQAACVTEDPELFFPVGTSGPALWQIEDAKQVCRRCDVIDACLEWALSAGEHAGVWGGRSELERQALLRHRRAPRTDRAARAGDSSGLVEGCCQ